MARSVIDKASGGLLAEKVAMISGTGGGQGRAAALAFAREGAKIVGCDVNADGARETVAMVEDAGGTIISLEPLDLANEEEARRWMDAAVDQFGGIDILYNNAAALFARGPFGESKLSEWELSIRNELTIVYVACRAVWRHLIARGGGVILTVSSISGHLEFLPLRSAAHSAAKAGVMGLTRTMAAEGAAHGIRAVSISPGMIRSPATQRFWNGSPEELARGATMMSKIPLGRPGEVEEIAEAAVFLASDRAAYITGTDLLIDGGIRCTTYSPVQQ